MTVDEIIAGAIAMLEADDTLTPEQLADGIGRLLAWGIAAPPDTENGIPLP